MRLPHREAVARVGRIYKSNADARELCSGLPGARD